MENEVADEGGFWARRRCDSCKRAPAMLFCAADAAYLCGACDARVHGGEHQAAASRHRRVWVCEVCQQAPAAVTCKADAATLCVTCDADIHSANTLASRHERARLVPFLEPLKSPAAVAAFLLGDDGNKVELAAPWLIPNTGHAHPKGSTGAAKLQSADYFFSEMDPFRDLDNASSIDARLHQTDSVVPVHTKVKGREDGGSLPPPPPPPFLPVDAGLELDCAPPRPSYSSYTTHSISHSVSSSEAGVVPDWSSGGGGGSSTAEVTNSYGGVAVSRADREARVMRYREKRKSRRFEKTIRYASRKAYAETRPRIRGRFVKREEIEAEIDPIYSPSSSSSSSAAALMVNAGYGVVPSFLSSLI